MGNDVEYVSIDKVELKRLQADSEELARMSAGQQQAKKLPVVTHMGGYDFVDATHSEDGSDICAAGDLRGEFLGCSFSQYRMERGIKLSLDDGVLSILLTDDQPSRQVGGDEPFDKIDPADLDRAEKFLMSRSDSAAFIPKDAYTLANIAMHCIREVRATRAALAPAAVAMPKRPRVNAETQHVLDVENGYFKGYFNGTLDMWDEVARLNRRAIPVGLLEKAADLLKSYQRVIDGCHSSEIERFDYQPEVQGTADELIALLGKEGEK